jgi:hypothetical protein
LTVCHGVARRMIGRDVSRTPAGALSRGVGLAVRPVAE